MRPALLAALAALVLLAGCSRTPAGDEAEPETAATETAGAGETEHGARSTVAVVARVLDGDTIRLRSGREVRLVQIDAPEIGEDECYASEARGVLAALLPAGTPVRLASDPRLDAVDEYGRLLRYVFRGKQNVNLALTRRGATTVWFYEAERGRYADALLRAARQARAAKRGLWGACPGTPFDPLHAASTGTVQPPVAAACPGAISFPEPLEQVYAGKTICVTGRIELYDGVAEIEVSSPRQIELAG